MIVVDRTVMSWLVYESVGRVHDWKRLVLGILDLILSLEPGIFLEADLLLESPLALLLSPEFVIEPVFIPFLCPFNHP